MHINFKPAALAIGVLLSGSAQAYLIDGNLSDWGLHQNGNVNDWTPNSSVRAYTIEDQTGNGAYYLSPGWGGQEYDAEALYLSWDANNLYIALVTGRSPTAGGYAAGDFALDFGKDGTFEFGIETLGANAGDVYQVSAWNYGLWDVNGGYIGNNTAAADHAHPTSIKTGTKVGDGSLVYTNSPIYNMGSKASDAHYIIETSVSLSLFNGYLDEPLDVHWTMNCANDSLAVDPIIGRVPEPGTLALLSLGLTGLLALRLRKTAFTA